MIDVLNLSGQQLTTYGHEGTGGPGELQYPSLCQQDSEGALLVADHDNHRLQLLGKNHKWSIVDMGPELKGPERAMYVDDALFVHSGGPENKIHKYIANLICIAIYKH